VAVVEAKLGLFQVQIEGMVRYPLELGQTKVGKGPIDCRWHMRRLAAASQPFHVRMKSKPLSLTSKYPTTRKNPTNSTKQ